MSACYDTFPVQSREQNELQILSEFNEKYVSNENNIYNPLVVQAFGGVYALEKYPVHDLGNRMGHTGYIDILRPDDLSSPIVKGVDCYGRPFVSVRVQNKNDNSRYVFTIFRRYTSPDSLWSLGMGPSIHFKDGYTIFSGDTVYSNDYKILEFVGRLVSSSDSEYELI